MRFALIFYSCLLVSCHPETNVPFDKIRVEAAVLYDNSLEADGCEESVRLETTLNTPSLYKPSAATLPRVQRAIRETPANPMTQARNVIIRFYETGRQVNLQCGWGNRPLVSEIEVLEVKPR